MGSVALIAIGGLLAVCYWLLSSLRSPAQAGSEKPIALTEFVDWPPLVAAVLVAAGVSLPGSGAVGVLGLWGCLVASVALAVRLVPAGSGVNWLERLGGPGDVARATLGNSPPEPTALAAAFDALAVDSIDDNETAPDDVLQQLVRRADPEGGEWITGVVRVRFDAGQKTAHAHVAFCPPFADQPTCDAESVSGPDSQLKVAQLLPQGARFDVRLDHVQDEPASVLVEFAAHGQS